MTGDLLYVNDIKWCFINKFREEHAQIINTANSSSVITPPIQSARERIPINNQAVLPSFSLVFHHSVCSFCHFITFPSKQWDLYSGFSDLPPQSASPRITPSPPDTAAELQALSRPPLCSTSHKISPTPGLNLTSTAETSNFPGILVSFGRANNSFDRKVEPDYF